MLERIVGVVVCAAAIASAGCGAQETVGAQTSAIESGDISGIPGCPGTWQLAESYKGFVGQYLRHDLTALQKGALMTLGIFSVAPEPNSIRVEGSYLASQFGSAAQGGTYEALESNPLIGALLILKPANASQIVFFVIGLRRNIAGNISALCLGQASETDSAPFELDRIGL